MAPGSEQRSLGPHLSLAATVAVGAVALLCLCTNTKYPSLARDKMAALWREDRPTLSIGLDRCWELEKDAGNRLTCWLDPLEKEPPRVRIIVRGDEDAELSVKAPGCQVKTCAKDAVLPPEPLPAGRCVDLSPGAPLTCTSATLRLSARGQVLGERVVQLAVPSRTELDALRADWINVQSLAGLEALIARTQSLAQTQAPSISRDRALVILALLIHDRYLRAEGQRDPLDEKESLDSLERAMQAARSRGWLRSEAELALALSWRHVRTPSTRHTVEAIERLLTDREWLELLPAQRVHCHRLLMSAAVEHQDLRRVVRYLTVDPHEVNLLNDRSLSAFLAEIRAIELEMHVLTSDRRETKRKLHELQAAAEAAAGGPCEQQADLWAQLGWLQLLLVELGEEDAEDPVPALEKAQALRASAPSCNKAGALANVWANLARARSAEWWRWSELSAGKRAAAASATRAALAEMRKALGPRSETEDASLSFDRWVSEVRIELLEGAVAQALDRSGNLSGLEEEKQGILNRWLLTVHKAEAQYASGRWDEAIASFRKADRQLLPLLHNVPIYQAHRLVLSRFGYSSQRAIELAVRTGRPAEAMEILRQFNQQALGLTLVPWWQEQAETANSAPWQHRRQEQVHYLARRADYERQISLARNYTVAQCQELNILKTRWLESLDAVFAEPAPSFFPLPPVPPGELLLGCARQRKGWICLGALNGKHKAVPIPAPELDQAAVEQILLPALADEVRNAVKIRVLAQGQLAQLDLGAIWFGGDRQDSSIPIYYSVDLPAAWRPREPKAALVVLNPDGTLSELSLPKAQKWLAPALGELRVLSRSADPSWTPPAPWAHGEALGPKLLADLQRSDIFVYLGHVDPMPCPHGAVCCTDPRSGLRPDERLTALQLAQDTALSAADVLMAERIPQRSILLGCASTDRSASTPVELVGLAQSFALRGGQSLGSARKIDTQTAAEVLCALGQQRLSAPDFNLGSFLVDTQRRFDRGERCKAQGRWYSCGPTDRTCSSKIDWAALRWYGP